VRLLHVQFKNLNSLAGEWLIDFTDPAYIADGLFAITGPTGAGKSTILDAICLALYGRTPRLKAISKSSNEIISRQTGECFAEVGFETDKGHYRCHWSQHRARRKVTGDLQAPKHEIVDAASDTVLENKLREVTKQVERVTGMDFDRFTRSILLAQGGFAAFLQASPDNRSPLLEQITGTEIYSQISQQAHSRYSDENRELDRLKNDLAGLRLLNADEERELRQQQKALQAREKTLSQQHEKTRAVLDWLAGIGRLEQQLAALEQAWQSFQEQQQAFQPQREALQRARQALRLDRLYDELSTLRQRQYDEQALLAQARQQYEHKTAAAATAQSAQETAEHHWNTSCQKQQQEIGLIRQVQELDRKLTALREQSEIQQQTRRQREQQCKQLQTKIAALLEQQTTLQTELETAERYRAEHQADAALIENLAGIEQRFEHWRELENQRQQRQPAAAKTAVGAARKQYAKHEAKVQQQRKQVTEIEQDYQQGTRQLEQVLNGREAALMRSELEQQQTRARELSELLSHYEESQTTATMLAELQTRGQELQTALSERANQIEQQSAEAQKLEQRIEHCQEKLGLLYRIQKLEHERVQLRDGKPCPLCGALEHPYAAGNTPPLDPTQAELKQYKTALRVLAKQLEQQRIEQAKAEQTLEQLRRDSTVQSDRLSTARQACRQLCERLAIAADNTLIQAAQAQLQQQIDQYTACLAAVEQLENKQKTVLTALNQQRADLNQDEATLRDLSQQYERAEQARQQAEYDLAALSTQIEQLQLNLCRELAMYGVERVAFDALDSIQSDLRQRRDVWREQTERSKAIEKTLFGLQADMRAGQSQAEQWNTELDSLRQQQQALDEQIIGLADERKNLYGDKDPTAAEQALQEALEQARENREQQRQAWQTALNEVEQWRRECERLDTSLQQLKQHLSDREPVFAEQLRERGFDSEVDYRAASLDHEQIQALEQQEKTLQREETELQTRREDTRTKLEQERAKTLSDAARDELQQAFATSAAELRELQGQLGALQDRLDENARQHVLQQARLQALEAQRRECERWNRLQALIGSHDGKKFRNFAQGLTFERMVFAANEQLQKMSDRYLLIRDREQPLDLNVIDQYQASEIRSTRNLSGGESFIVSLALALGLAQMASRNVRVDSLFLDEGFGTLDQDALETALNTLAGLRQDGKLIGVISHVAELKERINTQIQITPLPGGRSRLQGPGCRQVMRHA